MTTHTDERAAAFREWDAAATFETHSYEHAFNAGAEWGQARAAIAQQPALPPVEGDVLPPIGAKVLIHLASQDAWVEHTVAGYYVWPNHGLVQSVFRVFVRVRSSDGYLNARCLQDIRYPEPLTEPEGAAIAQPAEPAAVKDSLTPAQADSYRALAMDYAITAGELSKHCEGSDPMWNELQALADRLTALDAAQADAQPVAPKPDGRLHQDGYFTWARRDGYAMDRRLPCDFYLQPAAAPPARQPQWMPIESAPKDGKKLTLFYKNRNGLARTVMARWLTDEQAAETDADGVGLEGGWYECIDNWDDYTEVAIHEGEPSHWMPLPPPPGGIGEGEKP